MIEVSGMLRLSERQAGRVFVLASCVLLALSVTGCGKAERAETHLRVAIWGDIEEQRRVEEAAEAFEAANRGVEVTVEAAPGAPIAGGLTAYEQKLIVLIAAKDAPDVMYLPRERYEFYAENGALVDLEPFIDESDGARRLPPGSLEGMRTGDRVYGLAKDAGTVCTISSQTEHPSIAWELLLCIVGAARQ